jgi:D-glycero-D-manno-heptose 1,7-bisphosphate phosphatase
VRVVLVTSLRGFGGGEEWFARATGLLLERGHDALLVVRRGGALGEVARRRGLPVVETPFGGVADPRAVLALKRILADRGAEVAVCNLDKELRLLALASWGGPSLALVPRRGSDDALKDRAVERWLYGTRIARLLVNSAGIADTLRASLPALSAEKIALLPNGLDALVVPESERTGLVAAWPAGAGLRLLTVGELSARKNPAGIVRALATLPGAWRLLVVGEGPERPLLEGEMARLGVGDRVRLLGHVADARRYAAVADGFVHFSASEGQPWAVLEALAQGVPTVATRLPGVEDLVVEGVTGRLVAPGDEVALAAVVRGWQLDPVAAQALGAAAAERVQATHSEAALGDRLERLLETARLTRPGSPRRAVFLDRDGTLTPEAGSHGDPEALRLLPGAAAGLRLLDQAGYALVVVTNQAAVGRGRVTPAQLRAVHARLRALVRAEGVELAGIFVCPHRPEDACACRKPRPGLVDDACVELGLVTGGSWLVGDTEKDVAAARAAGVRPALVLTGWSGRERAAAATTARAGEAPGTAEADAGVLRARDLLDFAERMVGGASTTG